MNRLISILITLFVIFLIYIWINSVMSKKSETASGNIASSEIKKTSIDEKPGLKLSNYDANKDKAHSNMQGTNQTNDETTTEDAEIKADEPAAQPIQKEVETESSKPVQTSTTTITKRSSSADPSKKHIVIAGNYTHLENAKSFSKNLERQGYKDVEIVNFDFTQYHTVIAGRFDDLREARRISKKLQDHFKIDAYVRVGKS